MSSSKSPGNPRVTLCRCRSIVWTLFRRVAWLHLQMTKETQIIQVKIRETLPALEITQTHDHMLATALAAGCRGKSLAMGLRLPSSCSTGTHTPSYDLQVYRKIFKLCHKVFESIHLQFSHESTVVLMHNLVDTGTWYCADMGSSRKGRSCSLMHQDSTKDKTENEKRQTNDRKEETLT